MDVLKLPIIVMATALLASCATTNDSTKDYRHMDEIPETVQQRNAVFSDLKPYAVELLDEIRLLAKTRSAKANAEFGYKQRQSEQLYLDAHPDLTQLGSLSCKGCEIETVLKTFAQKIGYGADHVYSYGTQPPGGVIVDIVFNNLPMQEVLRQIDAQKGAQVDILLDPRTRNIVLKYLEAN